MMMVMSPLNSACLPSPGAGLSSVRTLFLLILKAESLRSTLPPFWDDKIKTQRLGSLHGRPGAQKWDGGWTQMLAPRAPALGHRAVWPRCVPAWACAWCLPVPSLPVLDWFPLSPSPNTPVPSPTQWKPGHRSRSCHFSVLRVTFCRASCALTCKQLSRTGKAPDLCQPSQKSFSKHDTLGRCTLFIQNDQVPLIHCHGPPGPPPLFFFCPEWRSMALHHQVSSPKGREPRTWGEGVGEEGCRECVGDELRVRQLLQPLRGGGGGAGRVESRMGVSRNRNGTRVPAWNRCPGAGPQLQTTRGTWIGALPVPTMIESVSIGIGGWRRTCVCVESGLKHVKYVIWRKNQ